MRRPTGALIFLIAVWLLSGLAPAIAGSADTEHPSAPAPFASHALLLDGIRVEGRLIAVGERGHILLSDDSGKNWTQAAVPTRATLTAVTFVNARQGWAVGHDAVVLHSSDGGTTWVRQFAAPDWNSPLLDVRFADPRHGFAVGAYGLLLETSDGGTTWNRRSVSDEDLHFNAVEIPAPNLRLIAGESGFLLISRDEGRNWQAAALPYHGSFFGGLALSADEILVFGLQGHVFRSADGGDTWTPVPTGTTAGLMGGTVLRDGRVVLVGIGGTVLISADRGNSFTPLRRPERAALSAVAQAPDGALLLFGESGAQRIEPPAAGTALAPAPAH